MKASQQETLIIVITVSLAVVLVVCTLMSGWVVDGYV